MEFMKEMQAQEMARQKAMMTVGGENPWEVGVNKDVVKGQQDLEDQL